MKLDDKTLTLVVGLGNWNVTPDALGPKVVSNMMVTRHLLEYLPDQVDEGVRPVCAVAPGVLGITGIETGEIVKGIVDRIRPDYVIAIDALAARKLERVNTTAVRILVLHPAPVSETRGWSCLKIRLECRCWQ